MAESLMFQLGAGAVERLHELQRNYGERNPETLISRALGLMEAVQPYVHEGALTVFNPSAAPDGDDRYVDLVFDQLRETQDAKTAA